LSGFYPNDTPGGTRENRPRHKLPTTNHYRDLRF
jgi:hypothetical protein